MKLAVVKLNLLSKVLPNFIADDINIASAEIENEFAKKMV